MPNTDDLDLNANATDVGTALTKGGLGIVPWIGPLLAEMVAITIPDQRLDRVVDFVQRLEKRISKAELEVLRENIYFVDLIEDAITQATKSLSTERNDYISTFMEINRNVDENDFSIKKNLLQTLQELTDDDIEILRSIHEPFYRNKFDNIVSLTNGEFSELTRAEKYEYELFKASKEAHINTLEKNKLIKPERKLQDPDFQKYDGDPNEHIDQDTGLSEVTGFKSTDLGVLLLKSIGIYIDPKEAVNEPCNEEQKKYRRLRNWND